MVRNPKYLEAERLYTVPYTLVLCVLINQTHVRVLVIGAPPTKLCFLRAIELRIASSRRLDEAGQSRDGSKWQRRRRPGKGRTQGDERTPLGKSSYVVVDVLPFLSRPW